MQETIVKLNKSGPSEWNEVWITGALLM